MNALQILVVVMAACCVSQGRNIRSRRFVNQPPPGLFPPGNNHIQALMALLNNPGLMKLLSQLNGQQQQQQPQQLQQQHGMGQNTQVGVTRQSATNKGQGQVQGRKPVQNAGQGQQGQTYKGQTQQAPVPAQTAISPMQQFMSYSNMFTDPIFLQHFQEFIRRVDGMKPVYRKGDFIPPSGLFPGGFVTAPDGTDADVRDIYGRTHTIDGGSLQA